MKEILRVDKLKFKKHLKKQINALQEKLTDKQSNDPMTIISYKEGYIDALNQVVNDLKYLSVD